MICPFKPFFNCAATAKLIADSRCFGCPEIGRRIVNNPNDGFGAEVGYRPEDYAVLQIPVSDVKMGCLSKSPLPLVKDIYQTRGCFGNCKSTHEKAVIPLDSGSSGGDCIGHS